MPARAAIRLVSCAAALLLAALAARPASSEATADVAAPSALDAEKPGRRARAAAEAGSAAVLLVLSPGRVDGVAESDRNTDFRYLSPLAARQAAVVCAAAGEGGRDAADRLYLPARNPAAERWTGPEPGPAPDTVRAAGFAEVRDLGRLAADLAELLRGRDELLVSAGHPTAGAQMLAPLLVRLRAALAPRALHLADPARDAKDPLLEAVRRAAPELRGGDAAPPAPDAVTVRAARGVLGPLREVKSAAEIDAIRRATVVTMEGHADAMRAVRPGLFEYHAAALVELRSRAGGCARQAYPSIAGSGPNSCVLHYDRNTRRLADGDLVVLDAGGEFEGYACDVTRTFPVSGRFTAEQAAVYDAVLAAQEAALAAVKPGVTLRQVHDAAWRVLDAKGLSKWFLHGTCHSVGLDVHDPWRRDAVLRPGCVLTVEPGVYDAARNLGVRIEDTVVVTGTGCDVLSADLPRTRAAVEALMAEEPWPSPVR